MRNGSESPQAPQKGWLLSLLKMLGLKNPKKHVYDYSE